MSLMSDRLRMVLEAEEKARRVLDEYRKSAEEIIARAREQAAALEKEILEEARIQGEKVQAEKLAHSRQEAEDLRWEYMFDRARLLAEVSTRCRRAVDLLLEKLEDKGRA